MEKNKELQLQRDQAESVINQRIFIIRGHKVMLGQDIALLYKVSVSALIQAMNRNKDRFPEDFVFQLTKDEFENLKSQFVISSWGGIRRANPYAFTEHGVAMLSAILKSSIAIQMSIFIVRAFIKMRESLETYQGLALKINEIEVRQIHDHATLKSIHEVVKQLLEKPTKLKRKIGFAVRE